MTATILPDINFTDAERQIAQYRPTDLAALNHNDLRSFVHAWFAAFDHADPADFFLAHLDDTDMTFNMDGQALAHDHASFREWYADALRHIPWDFHDILGITITGNYETGWGVEFFFRHVGEWVDTPQDGAAEGKRRGFNRILHANWQVEHKGHKYIIRRYTLAIAQNIIPI